MARYIAVTGTTGLGAGIFQVRHGLGGIVSTGRQASVPSGVMGVTGSRAAEVTQRPRCHIPTLRMQVGRPASGPSRPNHLGHMDLKLKA